MDVQANLINCPVITQAERKSSLGEFMEQEVLSCLKLFAMDKALGQMVSQLVLHQMLGFPAKGHYGNSQQFP